MSSALSMMIWGLVMAKAKTGMNAASSKDKETVGSAVKKIAGLMGLIGVATLAKLNADYNYIGSYLDTSSATPAHNGRLLFAP